MPLDKETYEARKRKGQCVQCQKPRGKSVRCDECVEKNQAARDKRRETRRAAGQCTECGRQAEPGHSLCSVCSGIRSEASTQRYYKNKEAGKCRLCGAETSGESRCPKHKQQIKDWRKRRAKETSNG